MYARLIV